ncbi:MAG: hypothetical protein LBO66_00865 [Deltaproteobacteria bacterium]|nr:hypothetical protein [Deltaproteobacteria bacterium]
MSLNVEVDPRAVSGLIGALNKCLKDINYLTNDLAERVSALGDTFQDEGYVIIRQYIAKTLKTVDDAVPDLRKVMSNLHEWHNILTRAQKLTSE